MRTSTAGWVPASLDGENKPAARAADPAVLMDLQNRESLNRPGTVRRDGERWAVTVPEKYIVGHEAHFAQVTENFLKYLRSGKLPAWTEGTTPGLADVGAPAASLVAAVSATSSGWPAPRS